MGDRAILIVDDQPADVELLVRALRQEQIRNPIVVAGTGREAMASLAEASRLPGLVLLDVVLPDIPGTEVLKRLRDERRTRDVPVVLFSGLARPDYEELARHLNADCLVKPMGQGALRELVRHVHSQWLTPSTDFIFAQMQARWADRANGGAPQNHRA